MPMQIPISRRELFAMLPLLPVAKALMAQTPTFTTDVNLVNLFVTVRDKDGRLVSNLTKEDFAIQEDGHPQTVRYFSRETDLPLTLGLLVDTSRSQRNVIDAERSASYTFFEHILRENKDQAFVLHFDHQVELLQDLTQSRQKLNKALHELEVNQEESEQQSGGVAEEAAASGWRRQARRRWWRDASRRHAALRCRLPGGGRRSDEEAERPQGGVRAFGWSGPR